MPVFIFSVLIKLDIFSTNIWLHLDKATNATHNTSLLQLLLVIELAAIICLLVFSLLLVSLFLKKKDTFPKALIVFIVCYVLFNLTDIFVFNYVYERKNWTQASIDIITRSCVAAAVLIPYMRKSEQVKQTFRN
jgi:uncharacterized membrane protein